ncbi:MFS transporter [Nonomuraea mesophila]|uniref:MFS transporter n=2 Tax=Nonomuraea mesophila TaxID=2530382 RepID=A0A4R5FRP3_9ACTN|nr:MFS transporter [Nonomuraea mesophila]
MASTIGSRTFGVAYPLLALAQTGSPAAAGLAGFALAVPMLVFYIPGGLLVDRVSARTIMLVTESGRWLTVVAVLLSMPGGGPSLPWLMVAAAFEGTLWVLYTLAETALLPSLVRPTMMWRAMAKSESVGHLASLVGRPLSGYLFGAGRYIPFALNAVLFVVSWLFFFALRRVPERPDAEPPLLRDLSAGFRALMDQPFLRGSILVTTFTNLMVNALIMIFVAGSAGMPSLAIGLVLAASGVGGMLGSVVAFFREPPREVLMIHGWTWVVALALAAVGAGVHAGPPFFAMAFFATGFAGAFSNVAIRSAEAENIDRRTLARVVGVSRLASHGALCLASPLGGLLVTGLGVTGGAIVLSVTMATAMALAHPGAKVRAVLLPRLPETRIDGEEPVQEELSLRGDKPPRRFGHVMR